MAKIKITADKIKTMLDDRYSINGQTLIAFEVADGTGGSANRWADAISMELWPSNGYAITGYEIKTSRSDWLNELKQPEKSQAISQYCDYQYLVAPEGVLGIDELPKTWGYISAFESCLRTKIKAPVRKPIAIETCFMASMLRRCLAKYKDTHYLDAMKKRITEDRKNYWKTYYERRIKETKELEVRVEKFENITGLSIDSWSYEKTATAVAALRDSLKRKNLVTELENNIRSHKVIITNIQKSVDALAGWHNYEPSKP